MEKINIPTLQNIADATVFIFNTSTVDKPLSSFYNRYTLLEESANIVGNITTFFDVVHNRYWNGET